MRADAVKNMLSNFRKHLHDERCNLPEQGRFFYHSRKQEANKMKWHLTATLYFLWVFVVLGAVPNPFDLATPSNDFLNVPVLPVLQWIPTTYTGQTSSTPPHYKIQVCLYGYFSPSGITKDLIIDDNDGTRYTTTSPYTYTANSTSPTLLNGQKYYWRVIAYAQKNVETTARICTQGVNDPAANPPVANACMFFRTVGTSAPLAAPGPFLPNTRPYYCLTPTITWSAVSSATDYIYQVSTSYLFTTLPVNTIVYNSPTLLLDATLSNPALTAGTRYYWRVAARSGSDVTLNYSNWESGYPYTFTTQASSDPVLSAPTLISPADGASIPTTSTFTCATGSSYTTYYFQFSENSSFSPAPRQIVSSPATGGTPISSITTTLSAGKTYYWRAYLTNGSVSSPMSVKRSFTTDISQPDAPTLKTPEGATRSIKTLSWNAPSTAVTKYQYRIRPSTGDYTSRIMEVTDPAIKSVAFKGFAANTTYYWQVRAFNTAWGVWSSEGTFKTEVSTGWDPNLAIEYAKTYTRENAANSDGAEFNPLYYSYAKTYTGAGVCNSPLLPRDALCAGDCSNFISQCLLAGGLTTLPPANQTTTGLRTDSRGVFYSVVDLFNWLTGSYNKGYSNHFVELPRGQVPSWDVEVGDVIQFGIDDNAPYPNEHSAIVSKVTNPRSPDGIFVCTHTYDRIDFPISSTSYASWGSVFFHRISHAPNGTTDYLQASRPPRILTINDSITYTARFFDSDHSGTVAKSWDWSLVLLHDHGEYPITSPVNEMTSPNPIMCDWRVKIGALPENYEWKRDANGQILGKVVVGCLDSDSSYYYHSAAIDVAFSDSSNTLSGGEQK